MKECKHPNCETLMSDDAPNFCDQHQADNEIVKLLEVLNSLLNPDPVHQSDGCPQCRYGVLINPSKEHWGTCNWNNARIVYERITKERTDAQNKFI